MPMKGRENIKVIHQILKLKYFFLTTFFSLLIYKIFYSITFYLIFNTNIRRLLIHNLKKKIHTIFWCHNFF